MPIALAAVAALAAAATTTTSAPVPRAAADPVTWPAGPVGRLEALALLRQLDADLLSHDSATLTLDRWCAAHGLAQDAKIVADRDRSVVKEATDDQRRELRVASGEPVRYRRVRLSCGDRVLSEADNWYVPGRLTPEMNNVLDTSDVAFGRAVQGLHFQRRTLSTELLWRPLPDGWETGRPVPADAGVRIVVPHELLRHRAVLTLPDGTPFSEVVETYTASVLDFPVGLLP